MKLFQEIVNRDRLQGIGEFSLAVYIDQDNAEWDKRNYK